MRTASLTWVFQALNENQVSYIVVDGLAVVAHGYGRLTHEVTERLLAAHKRRAHKNLTVDQPENL
ncbi:MAG: hypothetical protein K8S54_15035 [Spirochaetia bacterium]|nr:hypothetical protein [Spirochaetia bacterium]